jgi:DNA-binding MarR family transcriptional regulator
MEPQHVRLLVTAAEGVRVFPFAGLSTADVNGGPGVSHRAFEEHLAGREACLLEAFEQASALAGARASAAFEAQEAWLDRVRAGLRSLLEFFDEEPELARFLVVHSAQAGPVVLARRGEVLDALAAVLDAERAPARAYPPSLTGEALVSGVLGTLHGRLSRERTGKLARLTPALMSFLAAPFLGAHVAREELSRPLDVTPATERSVAFDLLKDPGGRRNRHRAPVVLRAIADEPGLSNRELALRAGVKNESQISRVLARFAGAGVIEDTRDASRPGLANAWQLTPEAKELERALRGEAPALPPTVASSLPADLAGRLDDRTASVLRVIGGQPWLSSREIAVRSGLNDEGPLSYVLTRLVALGLVARTRDARLRGAPNVWQLTVSGGELYAAIGSESPAAGRSVALDLMQDSGGRLSDRAISALRLIGVERGLSNRALARRVGIGEMYAFPLLARLAERGLIENTRSAGSENVWRLTASGENLERAVWHETPAADRRTHAFDLLSDPDAHPNARAVLVLKLIRAQPGMRTGEIARSEREVGDEPLSDLLARLARLGLIEGDPTAGESAWRLTVTGHELDRVIGRETPSPPRSLARELMERSGALNERELSVLRIIGAEELLGSPGLASRLSVEAEEDLSPLLARLAARGLIESTRSGGPDGAWSLTASGGELERAIWQETPAALQRSLALELLRDPRGDLDERAVSALRVIGAAPGYSSREIGVRVGIADRAEISGLLTRLARLALIENTPSGGRASAWRLTASGDELERAIWQQTPAAVQRVAAVELLRDHAGRFDQRALSLLALIGAEPGHSNLELARRVGIRQASRASALLARLARLGLIENTRSAPRQNTWRLTASGSEFDAILAREPPVARRTAANQLPKDSRGRLGHHELSALKLIAAHPGASSIEIARCLGADHRGNVSKQLVRLAALGLIENTNSAGHQNAWQLTAAGIELTGVTPREGFAPVRRSLTFALANGDVVRLNPRAIAVLKALASEPGLSNSDVGERVGIKAKSNISNALVRLARFGLVENAAGPPALFTSNMWQLTARGKELAAAILKENPDAGRSAKHETSYGRPPDSDGPR